MELSLRAFTPSLTQYEYDWDSDRKDIYGRDPEEVERRVLAYMDQFEGCPEDDDTTEAEEEALTIALEMDWCGTVRQLREGGVGSVVEHVQRGNHLESPF